ncbi:MAG: hypothetical protein LIO51_01595 [Clostridiales bacterium]|nr:hypothetical protein [Clostridiales bacterium]
MFSETVTFFHYRESVGAWYPYVLTGCHLETDRGHILKRYGPDSTDAAVLHVPCETDGDGGVTVGGLPWLGPKAWAALEEGLDEYVSFAPGDCFLRGTWDGSDVIEDTDYTDRLGEGFFAWLNRTMDEAWRVSGVSGPYHVLPHFEITGK